MVKTSIKRGRPLSFDRQAVLEAAMLTFWRFGYGGTSIADLTQAMNISAQSLYGAFGSKSDLYHETLDHYQEIFCSAMQNALLQKNIDCLQAIENMLLETAHLYTDPQYPKGCMVATANLGCASENCLEVAYVSRLRKNATKRIQERIELGIKTGDLLRSKTDAKMLAAYLSMIIQGMSVQAQDGASAKELKNAITNIMVMIRQAYTAF